MKTISIIALVLVASWPLAIAAQDEPPALQQNPFSRPPSDVILDDRVSVRVDDAESPTLELQATMIGSINKLANVSGRILKRGDEVQGYVLVAIHEQYAVFERDGRRTTVYVKPLQEEEPAGERR